MEWILDESGGVQVVKKQLEEANDSDPVFDAWLDFLEKDMVEHPEHLVPLTAQMYEDIVAELSGERGKGVDGLPPTLEELWGLNDEKNQ